MRDEERGHVDRDSFAKRREVRDLLRPFLLGGSWVPEAFERALEKLERHREIALRQVISFFREGRIADEMAAVEVLGRLARPADDDYLARVAGDEDAPESARVAAALVLLGHDATDKIASKDVSRLVLRWQARFLAEEPGLRAPLMRLYSAAPREERATWAGLQDRELGDPEGRAAIFEMLLEVEEDEELRLLLIDGLIRDAHPAVRAALRRIETRTPEERDRVTAALALLASRADPDRVPEGWEARVGYGDGTGSFPLRIDFRREGARPRSAIFVLNLHTGVREALPLTGLEVDRYDRLMPESEANEADGAEMSGAETSGAETSGAERAVAQRDGASMVPVPVGVALGLLVSAERSDQREERMPPLDFVNARRLLDPLADIRPRLPEARSALLDGPPARSSATLLDHAGYGGWFYDAGDHFLDDIRLDVLREVRPGKSPGDAFVDRAAARLAASGEPRRLARMLRHNALVHLAAGEGEEAATAEGAARRILDGGFEREPLVRRMIRESLHPGHYFLTPLPDVPERHDLASLLLNEENHKKEDVLRVDVAWILTRAMEVWLSRVPCEQRPHSDHVQTAVFAASRSAGRALRRFMRRAAAAGGEPLRGEGFGRFTPELRAVFRAALDATGFPRPRWDPRREFLLDLLVQALEALVFKICLATCPGRCLFEPEAEGSELLAPGTFPAGRESEIYLRTWPGLFLHTPSQSEEENLSAFIAGRAAEERAPTRPSRKRREPYRCPLCEEVRPGTTRARGRLALHESDEPPRHVCRRCQRRYRRDPDYRAEVKARLGRLVY